MREGKRFLFIHSLIEPKQMLLLLRFTTIRFPVYTFNTIYGIKSMWLLYFPVLLNSSDTVFHTIMEWFVLGGTTKII